MQHESNFWPGIYADLKSGLITWLLSIDPAALFTAAVLLACIYILRRKIARSLINIIASFFERLSVPLVDEIIERLVMPAQVLVVTFGFYLLFDSINLLDAGNGVLLRLLASVAIISVFATWYHLSGAFASVLRADSHSPVAVERDWIQRVADAKAAADGGCLCKRTKLLMFAGSFDIWL